MWQMKWQKELVTKHIHSLFKSYYPVVFNWNHFEMRLLNQRINFLFITACLKAVITGDTVTRLSIPIRGRGQITWKRPEVKFGRNVVKKKQHKNNQDEDKKSVINKKLIIF